LVATVDSVQVKLYSKPYKYRAGLIPMVFALSIGLLFSIAWFVVAAWMIFQSGPEFIMWGILIVLSTIVYCAYMGLAAYKIWTDSRRQYCLELTETEAVLSVIDRHRKKQSTQMVLLNDVRYGEYYPYPDTASVILHTSYVDMEIPLWPFCQQAQDALDFLEGRGVHIINVQSDDKIPD
jgi:hypothetical protein